MNRRQSKIMMPIICLMVLGLWACATDKTASNTDRWRKMVYKEHVQNDRFDNSELKRQVFDMNGDTFIDVWKFYQIHKRVDEDGMGKPMLVRKEIDVNFDGFVDHVMYYNAQESLIREEMDINFDGKIDRILHFTNGLIVKNEVFELKSQRMPIAEASELSIHPSLVKHYRNGRLTREERINKIDGSVEVVTIYNAAGEIVQIGNDLNGDGRIDEWKRF